MPDFSKRSYEKELLDGDAIPFDAIRRNMQELDIINHRLGGHRITLEGIKAFAGTRNRSDPFHIVEIGCGGGDNLRVIQEWGLKQGLQFHLTGIDINPECIRYAGAQKENSGIEFICADYKSAIFKRQPDVIFSSLFCHHFTDSELVAQLAWMRENSSLGFFINDLHRHPLAYYSIKLLTRSFSKSYLVKADAPLSVRRGFTRKDWEHLLTSAGLTSAAIRWRWAFRWLILYRS